MNTNIKPGDKVQAKKNLFHSGIMKDDIGVVTKVSTIDNVIHISVETEIIVIPDSSINNWVKYEF